MKRIIALSAFTAFTFISEAQTLKEAQRLNDNEQYESAGEKYKLLIAKEPNNGINYFYYGENMLDAENQDSAFMLFNIGLQVDPANALNNIGLAEIKLSQGNLNEAKLLIDKALAMGANKNVTVLMEAAEAYTNFKGKDLITAQTLLATALKLEPKNSDLYLLNGDVYSELNNGTEAAINYNRALELDKTQVKALLHKGQLYKRSNSYESAAAEFQNTLKIDPNFAPAYREIAEVSFAQKKLEDAKVNYKKYLELSKNNSSARLRYASFLFYSKSYAESLAELNLINNADSTNIGYTRLAAYLNAEVGDSVKAQVFINQVFNTVDTAKLTSRDYEYRGRIMIKNGEDSTGTYYMTKAFEMEPLRTDLLDDIAKNYLKAKKYTEAVATYEKKIATGKNVTTTDYFNLGKAYYSLRLPEKADSAFSKYIEVQPNWAPVYAWRGRANALIDSTGKAGLGKPYYEKFLEMAQADSANISKYKRDLMEANQYLAFYYFVKKDCNQSIAYWKKVLDYDPENKQAKDSIKQIREDKSCK